MHRPIVNNARQLTIKIHAWHCNKKAEFTFLAISSLLWPKCHSSRLHSFRNKLLWIFYETIHTSTSISWIYGFQMKQSFANSPFIVDLSISHWSVIYIKLLTTQTFHPQAKRLHYDNKVNFSSCSYVVCWLDWIYTIKRSPCLLFAAS